MLHCLSAANCCIFRPTSKSCKKYEKHSKRRSKYTTATMVKLANVPGSLQTWQPNHRGISPEDALRFDQGLQSHLLQLSTRLTCLDIQNLKRSRRKNYLTPVLSKKNFKCPIQYDQKWVRVWSKKKFTPTNVNGRTWPKNHAEEH